MFNSNSRLRSAIIALLFVLGVIIVYIGWTMTGKVSGLLLMIFGVILLLTAVFVYNKPYR
ncbi:MAG: hypothetical protein J6Q74_03930 [Clostridia bacterium]|nr:hypothetical protein [Clostridia bacterium]